MALRKKSARRPDSPNADAWDKLANREPGETLAHRDVFTDQQLDRSTIEARQGRGGRVAVAIVGGALVAALVWLVYSMGQWGLAYFKAVQSEGSLASMVAFTPLVLSASIPKVALSLGVGVAVFAGAYTVLMRNLDAQNLMNDTVDINQYQGDQHIALPEEIVRKFDWFPDVGAHSDVQVSSMISHVMLSNKGLKKIKVSRRAKEDVAVDGEIEYLRGEVLYGDDDEPIMDTKPMIDEQFGEDLFDASGLPKDKKLRRRFDATKIPYNPDGSDRDKLGKFETVADMINADWTFPDFETQRPAGAYLVDTAPVNTMVLAITRAGKGQTVIEPTIDMWLREKRPNNMVINDPKGELLVKHYVRATMRGFQVIQFNLINAMKTDIYNPLGMAAEAAREGDIIKCAQYVENIAEVFFPLDGGDDPFWANAASNAFKRVAYGLIDFFMEEERKLRAKAERDEVSPKILDVQIDEMWGKVTLYNCYQFFVQLSAKKKKNPMTALEEALKAGEYGMDDPDSDGFEDERYLRDLEEARLREPLWNGSKEIDLLSLYFAATEHLPTNSMRTLIVNANNSLKSMGGTEKTMATVYGIAITAMSFFTDPTIMRLTSGAPSQNTDLGGLSFPRRFGVRFAPNYLTREHLVGTQASWQAFADPEFTQSLGRDFFHEDTVSPEGWARYYFEGKFPSATAYLRLEITNAQTGLLIKTFFFRFTKDHQTSLNGRVYITDPVTGEKIIKNGVLEEMVRTQGAFGPTWAPGHTMFPRQRLTTSADGDLEQVKDEARAIMQTMVRYSETPKAVFLVTPPHLMKYAKLLLILIKQLVDLNFDKSYMTKSNQKPLYKTRFMLDELGNLQSEGHGIAGFETMLSIGLGQEQQFTIILQTLQQLRDVYGESVDKIVQGNAQPLDAKILTPRGWKRMGDVEVGDQVLTPFGTTSSITGVFPKGVRPVYRVTLRDGSTTEACNEHLWAVEKWRTSVKTVDGKRVGAGPEGKTCVRVSEVITTDELRALVERGTQVDLPWIDPVAFPEADLPIDPYVLGAILGDGHIQSNGVVKFTCKDTEIVDEIRRRGYAVVDDKVRGERRDGTGYRINGVNKPLREMGLTGKRSWEKVIPEVYLRGSVEQRIDLLRGLMDTDGTISKTSEIEFSSASKELAEGVQALVRSLGGRVAVNVKPKVVYTSPNQREPKAGRPAFRVQNVRLGKINPFWLGRKAERWAPRTDSSGNRVVSVERVGDAAVQCIAVADERHLYVTDDFIPTHNTSNIVFLKSTDDSMLDTLQKMSGTRHTVYRDSKTVTKDVEKLVRFGSVEGKVAYTMTTKEEPVISYNDMAFISERNSILFRAGDSPVWNRNETILPMSWRLFRDTIIHPGHDYSLQTIPTLSSVADYDVRRNQPDFFSMLEDRIAQATRAEEMKEKYRKAFGFTEMDVSRLDPDVYSDDVMALINEALQEGSIDIADMPEFDMEMPFMTNPFAEYEDNVEVIQATAEAGVVLQERQAKRYAEGLLSREDLGPALDSHVLDAYLACMSDMHASSAFSAGLDGSLRSADGQTVYISKAEDVAGEQMREFAADASQRVFAEDGAVDDVAGAALGSWRVHREFYDYLRSLASWQDIAGGEFDRLVAAFYRKVEERTLQG